MLGDLTEVTSVGSPNHVLLISDGVCYLYTPTGGPYTYLGCWADNEAGVIHGGERTEGAFTLDACYYFAKERNWEVFAFKAGITILW